jgi:hypothetical protein
MRITSFIATTSCGLALLIGPGLAAGDPPPGSPSGDHPQAGRHPAVTQTPAAETPPGPTATAETKAKAYGKHCQGQSKKHVAGRRAPPFSRRVTAMAKGRDGQGQSHDGVQDVEQEARRRPEGHAVQPLRRGSGQGPQRAVGEEPTSSSS